MKSFKGLKELVQELRRNNNFRASLLGEVKDTFYLFFQNELNKLKTAMFGQSVQSYAISASPWLPEGMYET